MQAPENVERVLVVVAEVLLENVQSGDEVVASQNDLALVLLQLRQIAQSVSEHLMVWAELFASHVDRLGVEGFRLFILLPALMLRALPEQVCHLVEDGAGSVGGLRHADSFAIGLRFDL
jgi:hypothetical protein